MSDIYNILMSVPLLNGVSQAKMLEIVGKVRFHFLKFAPGEKIVSVGEPCTHLKIILSGNVKVITEFDNRYTDAAITMSQVVAGPAEVAISHLFGPDTTYPSEVVAVDNVNALQIQKSDYMKLVATNQIFMFNFLNALSAAAQYRIANSISFNSGQIRGRLAYFINLTTRKNSSKITITPLKKNLYDFFGCTEKDFYATIETLNTLGLTEGGADAIKILSRTDFINIFRQITD